NDRLVGEGLQQLDLRGGKWPRVSATTAHEDCAQRFSVAKHWNRENGPAAASLVQYFARLRKNRVVIDVRNMDHPTTENRRACRRRVQRWTWVTGAETREGRRRYVVVSDKVLQGTVELVHRSVLGLAQPHGALHNGIEHGLRVGGRAGDHTQDLAGGRLLLQRLLRGAEEAHVLNRSHRLFGDGPDYRALLR